MEQEVLFSVLRSNRIFYMRKIIFTIIFILIQVYVHAAYILVPMDESQKNHLKAYGITYWVLSNGAEAFWLLNYEGGSFAFRAIPSFESECKTRGISYKIISDGEFANIRQEIANPEVNQDVIKLEKAPKICVYTPDVNDFGEKIQPWDDAVTLVLTYAEIPYDIVYDREVLEDKLAEYDWLHLHHEDFTGQYGKFYASYSTAAWYKIQVEKSEALAKSLGFSKVSQCKLAVAKKIKEFVGGGGFMFAMCSATDSYDIALAAEGVDICAQIFDGDGADQNMNSKMNYDKCLAFKDWTLVTNPMEYEFSSIDHTTDRPIQPENDYFTLFDFSAKWDPIPTMLTQNHTRTVKGFMGQTTAFKKQYVKPGVLVMGETASMNEVRYIHNEYGYGTWTFYGGHDPEDYQHRVNDPPTDLDLHPNSPGYRLILNNILFPAAKKKQRKT